MASRRNYIGNIRAPEFPVDVDWLNTDRPLSLAQLRGKLVLLDFWTYGCINCIHIIPDLKRLEALYSDELVVIGVHSAKFTNEGDLRNIRQVLLRYGVEHPVINDRDLRVWQAYAVRAWPTTILIDPTGRVLAAHSGEGVWEAYRDVIPEAIERFGREGALSRAPLELVLERSSAPQAPLSYPGKVLADGAGRRLFIADSSHNRIIVTDLSGNVLEAIGSGEAGLHDGAFADAAFARPQGLALKEEILYIADTENHAIRAADLDERRVRTLAGDGQLTYRAQTTDAAKARLNSPWDLVSVGDLLFIAMAGMHQVWVLDLIQQHVGPYAGSGLEGLLDGSLARAAMAQPSGITTDGKLLYVADSEASAIRAIDIGAPGRVHTLVGEGLFEFGDVDGAWPRARLQHALGVTIYEGKLFVADTYNHKIKTVDLERNSVSTALGTGEPGWADGSEPQFYEPGGLSGAEGQLYIADTNNNVIRVADLQTRRVSTLALRDPKGLLVSTSPAHESETLHFPPQKLRPGIGSIELSLELPQGYKLNDMAPSMVAWRAEPGGHIEIRESRSRIDTDTGAMGPVSLQLYEGSGVLHGDLVLYYCAQRKAALCLIKLMTLEIPVTVALGADAHEIRAVVPIRVSG